MKNRIKIGLTIDVEPNISKIVSKTNDKYSGLTKAIPKILDVVTKHAVPVTWFITHDYWSKINLEFPSLVEKMNDNGEIGCHVHFRRKEERYYSDYDFQMEIIEKATSSLRSQGYDVRSFRGGNYFFDENTLKVLEELNYQIDSSVVPGLHSKLYPDVIINHKEYLCNEPYFPSYKDHRMPGNSKILEIPLSICPYFEFHGKLISVYLGNILNMKKPARNLLKNVKKIIRIWRDKKNIPIALLTAHPWDFLFHMKERIHSLEKFIIQIQNQLNAEFVSLSKIKRDFVAKNGYEFKQSPLIITKSDFHFIESLFNKLRARN